MRPSITIVHAAPTSPRSTKFPAKASRTAPNAGSHHPRTGLSSDAFIAVFIAGQSDSTGLAVTLPAMPGSDVVVDDETLTHAPIQLDPVQRDPIRRGPAERRRAEHDTAEHDTAGHAGRGAEPRAHGGWGVVAAAIVGAVLPQAWFRPGRFIATGRTGPALEGLGGVTKFWSNAIAGTGSTTASSSTLPERLVMALVRSLGGSSPFAQRIWFTLVVSVCAASVAWLALALVRRPAAVLGAGVVAVLNPYHLTSLPDLAPMIFIASVSLVLGVAARRWHGDHVPAFFGVAIAFWSAGVVASAQLLAVFAVVAVAAGALCLARGPRAQSWRLMMAFVAGSVFWTVPLFVHLLTDAPGLRVVGVTDARAWLWTQAHTGLRNVVTLVGSWTWGDPELVGHQVARLARFPWSWLRWALPCAVAMALLFSRHRRATRVLGASIAVLVVLAAGHDAPFYVVFNSLHDVVPGFWLIRQPMVPFGALLVICAALVIAIGVDDARWRWETRFENLDLVQTMPALLGLLAIAVVFVHPLVLGTVIPGTRPYLPSARVALPASWPAAGAALDSLPGAGATLVLPLSDRTNRGTVWGFYGIDDLVARVSDRPALFTLPGGYYEPDGSSPDLMVLAETAMLHQDRAAFGSVMAALGTGYLAVRTDPTLASGRRHSFANPAALLSAAKRMGLRQVGTFRYIDLFAMPGADVFDGAARTVAVDAAAGTPAAQATAVAASLLPAGTVISASTSAVAAGRGLAWVPRANDAGVAMAVAPGRYRTGVVPLGPGLWRATTRDGVVTLTAAERAEVNGRSMVFADGPQLRGRHDPFALLVRDHVQSRSSTIVPLGRDALVQIPPAATVTLLTAASDAVDFTDRPVGNCDNTDGLPGPSIDGLGAHATTDGVRLVALSGSACVAVPVGTPPSIDGHRRWRLTADYETSDAGTARTCLWLVTLGRCADGSRVVPNATAGHLDVVVDAFADDLTGARLVLAADHPGPTGDPTTTVRFSAVHLAPVSAEGGEVVLPAPDVAPVSTDVTAADGAISLSAGNSVGELLGRFDLPGDDCNRYDDVPSNVKVVSLGTEPAPALELTADRHTACASSPVAISSGVRDVTVTFGYQSSGAAVARVALVDVGSGRTVQSAGLEAASFWTDREIRMQVPPPSEGSADVYRLVLYADGPGPRDTRREVRAAFRAVRVSPSTPFAMAVLPDDAIAQSSAVVVRALDDRYASMRADGDAVLAFRQAYAPGWSLDGLPAGATARHIEVDGWANGWVVSGLAGRSVVLRVRYRDDPLVSLAVWSLLAVVLVGLACTDWRRARSNRVRQ